MTETQAKVVKSMAENQLNMTRTAKALHYHKTNIYKHVIRVLNQTGKDMRDFYDMTQLLMEAEVVLWTARGKRYASLMEPDIQAFTDEFGAVLNCAVRYCIGRRTYMPKLVMDVIRPMLPALTDKTLWCFERDIEGADNYGADNYGADYDEEEWMRFLSEVKVEIARRDANADRE